jgi:alkylation response protein AidB-like acyl-CoA dehydrogenase
VDLSLTEPQELLRTSARSFVEREAPRHALVASRRDGAGLATRLWRKAAELGWPGILVPAEYGGGESSLADAGVLFEELGRGPVPGPFFSSGVLGALTELEAGNPAQRDAILPALARGETVLSVAITEPNASCSSGCRTT